MHSSAVLAGSHKGFVANTLEKIMVCQERVMNYFFAFSGFHSKLLSTNIMKIRQLMIILKAVILIFDCDIFQQ